MANLVSDNQSEKRSTISEQEMLAQGESLGRAMQGMLKDAFAEAVVNAALGKQSNSPLSSINQEVNQTLQSLLIPKSDLDPSHSQNGYKNDELKAVREHIEQYFGPIYLQVEDAQKEHIRCDIEIIQPDTNSNRNHYYLVTKGMGAHVMPVPDEFKDLHLQRAELFMSLPSNWDIESELEQYSWPITLLSVLSRLPFVYNSWMAQGHIITFPKEESYAPHTNFAGAIVIKPYHDELNDAAFELNLNDQAKINFYQVVLLYAEELKYAEQYSARTLMKLMDKSAYLCDPNRPLTKLRKPKRKPTISS